MNIGINEMIQMQLKLMQDIAGVHGAIQGKSSNSGTAAALYAQGTQNASLNVLDYLETFSSFCRSVIRSCCRLLSSFIRRSSILLLPGVIIARRQNITIRMKYEMWILTIR